ncbi:hypothetical protein ACIQKB_10325 [Streptomyces sp. NPDC092046]|uniref:hypothetical protein n=1 Tax=Streptomyces sp. NPDC092046 TaxID=3366009 RepID=UPI00380EF249
MRRAAIVGAGAVLALAAMAVSSAEAAAEAEAAEAEGAADATGADGSPMPDFLGKGLWRVFTSLDPRTRLDVHDVGGGDRRVLWPPHWRVCTQHPAPGGRRRARGRVVVGVVKKGEVCPARVTAARR